MLESLRRTQASDRALRVGVVLAVVVVSFYFGQQPSPLFLLLVVTACGSLVLMRRPELGLLALVVGALCVPFAIGTGTNTPVNVVVMLIPALVVMWLLDMARRRDVRLVASPVNPPAIIFALVAIVAFLGGNLPWNYFASRASLAAQGGGLAIFLLSVAAMLLAGNQIRNLRWLKAIVAIFLAFGGIVVVGRIMPPVAVLSNRLLAAGATGSLFWVWIAALAGGLGLFDRSLGKGERMGLLALGIASVAVGWFLGRGWASGWLPGMVVILVLAWLYSPRTGIVVTLLAAVFLAFVRPELPRDVVAGDAYSAFTRQEAWKIVLGQVLPNSPLIGLGPANYYHYTPLYPILGYYIPFNSHNQYVDILAQIGILGMAAFLWLMAALARLAWDVRRRASPGFTLAYSNACLAGLAGSLAAGMLGDWFLPFVYNIGLTGFRASVLAWVFLGGLIAVQSSLPARPSDGGGA